MAIKQAVDLLLKKGLIGLNATIIESRNKENIGKKGKITDETKNMIVLNDGKHKKKFIKEENTFKITIENQEVIIEGKTLESRPEERIKKWLKAKNKITRTLE